MNEAEWMACDDTQRMFDFMLGGNKRSRKRMLYWTAMCWQLLRWFPEASWHNLCAVLDEFADGSVDLQAICVSWANAMGLAVDDPKMDRYLTTPLGCDDRPIPDRVYDFLQLEAISRRFEGRKPSPSDQGGPSHSDRLRCIFGNPFRRVSISPAWLTWNGGMVPKFAQTIYDERRFEDLPILGDMLEDAGCTNEDVLSHLRTPSPHGRGCWAVDILLGKE